MSIFKCKMCGGDVELTEDKTIGICGSCGTTATFPKISDEQKLEAFNRGNYFRRLGEFDKALALYENIVREDDSDAEAHWCCALCRFGIEYVEDPVTFEYIPTCHRASFDSFTDDIDYLAAIENADGITRRQYQKDASKIVEVQRGILATSQNEEPFDVFICYKETDENGNRTLDSMLAQDIYYQLTDAGLRVFFSRITLEDKAGTEYEPYIFAALNSAKAMVCVGTKAENFNAVWVKNEWSRFLALMRHNRSKVMLPCYKDMNPYDLPEQLSVLQSYDMSKIGFIQDLIRGIKKITAVDEPKTVVKETVIANNANIASLLKRVFMFLEDGDWDNANTYCEKVLDQDPECAEAYLGKLMAELKVKTKDSLKDVAKPFDNNNNFAKASKFSSEIAKELAEDNKFIRERNETARQQEIYIDAKCKMGIANTEGDFKAVASIFGSIADFKDADEQKKKCLEKAEIARKDAIYDSAKGKMNGEDPSKYKEAIKEFEKILDWKDSRSKINECNKKIVDIRIANEKAKAERKRKAEEERIAAEKAKTRTKKILSIAISAACVVIAFIIVLNTVIIPKNKLNKAVAELNKGNYDSAYAMLEELGKSDIINSSKYDRAIELMESGDIGAAMVLFSQCKDFKDSKNKLIEAKLKNAKVGDIINFGNYYQSNSTNKEKIMWRVLEIKDGKALIISYKALDCVQYNTSYTDVTWETCTLRTWLNKTFYNVAFNADEQARILTSVIVNEDNSAYDTDGGNTTNDKIFLLSLAEASEYFKNDSDRKCIPTAYAKSNGARTNYYNANSENVNCSWWLRSPGGHQYYATCANSIGAVYYEGYCIDDKNIGIRPAMWIYLSGNTYAECEAEPTTENLSKYHTKSNYVPSTTEQEISYFCETTTRRYSTSTKRGEPVIASTTKSDGSSTTKKADELTS